MYLFLGYLLIWFFLFAYLLSLGLKFKALDRKLTQFETYWNQKSNG